MCPCDSAALSESEVTKARDSNYAIVNSVSMEISTAYYYYYYYYCYTACITCKICITRAVALTSDRRRNLQNRRLSAGKGCISLVPALKINTHVTTKSRYAKKIPRNRLIILSRISLSLSL